MLRNTDEQNRKSCNANLLSILTKRQTKSMSNVNKNWPGKLPPNFVLTKNNKNIKNSRSLAINFPKRQKTIESSARSLIRPMTLVKGSSSSISLKPSSGSKIRIISQFKNPSKSNNFFLEAHELKDKKAKTEINFKNKKLSSYLKSPDESEEKRKTAYQILEGLQSEKDSKNAAKKQNKLKNFEIQYEAFNFIGKVIDNPQKWLKYVKKKEKDADFITQNINNE